MEDDIEVELELEKQLALARELFPTGGGAQTTGGWPWSSSQQQSGEDNVIRANV